jgi:Uma2 family endonuclease
MGMALSAPRYTVAQLRDFPHDGNRYELLDGVLLVTPGPSYAHQLILSRLQFALTSALVADADARAVVVAPGEVQEGDTTLLEPDLLVVPAHYPPSTPWKKMTGWWLAVEVMSRSSRVYDRDFKRAAYLEMGVEEVWLVDPRERVVDAWRAGQAAAARHDGTLDWRPRQAERKITVDLAELFRGL